MLLLCDVSFNRGMEMLVFMSVLYLMICDAIQNQTFSFELKLSDLTRIPGSTT